MVHPLETLGKDTPQISQGVVGQTRIYKTWKSTIFYLSRSANTLKIIKQLRQSCLNEDGTDDQKKGTTLLEIFALEIQMHTETKNNKKLKEVYQQCLLVKSAIPHPRIMGTLCF